MYHVMYLNKSCGIMIVTPKAVQKEKNGLRHGLAVTQFCNNKKWSREKAAIAFPVFHFLDHTRSQMS